MAHSVDTISAARSVIRSPRMGFLAPLSRIAGSVVDRIGLAAYAILVVVATIALLFVIAFSLGIYDSTGNLRPGAAPSPAMFLALTVPPALLACLLLYVPFHDRDRRARNEEMARIAAGQHWAHWRFSPQAWSRFLGVEHKSVMEEVRIFLLLGALFGGVLGAIAYSSGGLMLGLLVFAAIMGASLLPIAGSLLSRNRVSSKDVDVYITPNAVLMGSDFTPLNLDYGAGYAWELEKAKLTADDPPIIEFTVQPKQSRLSGAIAGSRTGVTGGVIGAVVPNATTGGSRIVRVPVPANRVREAEALIARFGLQDRPE